MPMTAGRRMDLLRAVVAPVVAGRAAAGLVAVAPAVVAQVGCSQSSELLIRSAIAFTELL